MEGGVEQHTKYGNETTLPVFCLYVKPKESASWLRESRLIVNSPTPVMPLARCFRYMPATLGDSVPVMPS